MAYLHCHTKNCGWEQDDFWDKEGYNPFKEKDCLFKEKYILINIFLMIIHLSHVIKMKMDGIAMGKKWWHGI